MAQQPLRQFLFRVVEFRHVMVQIVPVLPCGPVDSGGYDGDPDSVTMLITVLDKVKTAFFLVVVDSASESRHPILAHGVLVIQQNGQVMAPGVVLTCQQEQVGKIPMKYREQVIGDGRVVPVVDHFRKIAKKALLAGLKYFKIKLTGERLLRGDIKQSSYFVHISDPADRFGPLRPFG